MVKKTPKLYRKKLHFVHTKIVTIHDIDGEISLFLASISIVVNCPDTYVLYEF